MGTRICEETLPNGRKITLHQGDITLESVDVIVNAANSYLAHGGGVAAAIVRRGGSSIEHESTDWVSKQGPVPVGECAPTGAGHLPCKAVLHAVGPRWGEGDEDRKLQQAIRSALRMASHFNYSTIAFPAISSGIFGFPKERCARIFWKEVRAWLEEHPDSSLREVRFTLIDAPTIDCFLSAWKTNAQSV